MYVAQPFSRRSRGVIVMAQAKQLSSVVSQKTAAVRSRALPYVVDRKTGPSVSPMATTLGPTSVLGQPGQTTTCIAYAFQPSQGQEAILLIPTTAFKVELRDQAGQKVLQLLPPSNPFPFLKVASRPFAAAATAGVSATTHRGAAGTSQQTTATMTASSYAASDKSPGSSATVRTATTRFQTCPASWANALRLGVGGQVLNGKCAVVPSGGKMALARAPPLGSEEVREQLKQEARNRYNRNDALLGEILDERIVRVRYETTGMSELSERDSLISKVQSAMLDAEQIQRAREQKMNEIAEADALFHYKMDRFKEVASLMNSEEFHKAAVEAELIRLSEMSA